MTKEFVVFFAPALFTRSVLKGECDFGEINAQRTTHAACGMRHSV